jgi:hypothetical protein
MSQKKSSKSKRWSARVTKHSNALDLEPKVFRFRSPRKITLSSKRSAERNKRRKARPYQSAMAMFEFLHQSRRQKSAAQGKRVLERANPVHRTLNR